MSDSGDSFVGHERACGRRIAGGVYAEVKITRDGSGAPVEYFLVDPPRPIDLAALGLTSVGVKLIEIEGVTHVFDVVGQEYYPYPADFVEETRQLGASRRLSANLDFEKLGPGSCLVLIHAKALIRNYLDYPLPECPKGMDRHATEPTPEMCAGLWWGDLPEKGGEAGRVVRKNGVVRYTGWERPADVEPRYAPAIFISLPITNLTVIRGGGEKTEKGFDAAHKSHLDVNLEDD